MTHPIRFHVLIIPTTDWPEVLRRAQWLETLGLDAVMLPDHLVDWTNPSAPWYDPWTALAALAQATSTIRLGTAVTQIPLRNPAMLARQVLTLDQISHGRIELGLGAGLTIDPSYRMGGFPNWPNAERADRFGEYLDLVAQLLSQETTNFAGRYYQADGAVMNPRPIQQPRPPIMVAALGPKMMRHAVRHADSWNSLSFLPSFPEQLAETHARIATINRICAELGRDPTSLQRSYTMFDTTARHNGGAIAYYQSPDAFLAQIEPLLAVGITDLGLYYPFLPNQLEVFERIVTEVVPVLANFTSTAEVDIFKDDPPYLEWLESHPEGFVLNINTSGPRKHVIHSARCSYLYPPKPEKIHTTYAKACSHSMQALERMGEQPPNSVEHCSNCLNAK
jgi:alkanesulfonate monooxygenase SsuD/methylene tetrahydromethanopterin reductase-like flavin-dependent oxidoreductase (luciferase family)